MKKTLLTLLMLVASVGAYAQKSYVTVYCPTQEAGGWAVLSGDIPSTMMDCYYASDFDMTDRLRVYAWIGKLLNLLAENGFTVEQMNTIVNGSEPFTMYLLSKPASEPSQTVAVQKVQTGSEGDVREVARYNLQGLPVGPDEKGLQIIVYSNYTTKALIVE